MNENSDFSEIDKLLGQPPLISEGDFVARVDQRINKLHSMRRNLFLVTGCCWLALVLVFASPQEISADILALVFSLDLSGVYTFSFDDIQRGGDSVQQLPYSAILTAVLSVGAIVSVIARAEII